MALKEQLSELLSVKLVFIGEYPSSSGTIEEFEADADDLARGVRRCFLVGGLMYVC